jgi:pimeloyl-ACP methyl ester carboxylesterase
MAEFVEKNVRCLSSAGFHQLNYVEWGDARNPRVLFCVHGLTRCGRDFDDLAQALAGDYRVVCPDVAGRGRSDWLVDKNLYSIPQYCADMATLLAQVNGQMPIETLHWVGTSMGGLIGMALAAQPKTPIARLVLNDVGPVVTAVSIQRIGEYVGKAPQFDSVAQAEAFVRAVSTSFGPHTDAQWRQLTEHIVRTRADGRVEFCYDPDISVTFRQIAEASGGKDMELWPVYDAIRCPTLLLRGADSDLLTHGTAQAMTARGPAAKLIEFTGIGHAPSLLIKEQITSVCDFLCAA